ncbi:uncharacterized protein LOC143034298 [Oratosquilla oratoria]|uniref:uncharacterized protein LOC143034298 n=1 Tax=Oratosquilla oratoria TaxID=337810 RepID=UPI003F760A9B
MLQNSTDFIERIKGFNLRREDVLVSLDVEFMFTSIPRELTKRALNSAMEENRGFLANQKLSLAELMGLVPLCLDSTYFPFRDHTYHQRKGTTMGSPISVVVAEVVTQRLEDQLLSVAPSLLELWTEYVDDVFAILDSKDVEPFFSHINSIKPAIEFSMELEKAFQLSFLDVNVKRKGLQEQRLSEQNYTNMDKSTTHRHPRTMTTHDTQNHNPLYQRSI